MSLFIVSEVISTVAERAQHVVSKEKKANRDIHRLRIRFNQFDKQTEEKKRAVWNTLVCYSLVIPKI